MHVEVNIVILACRGVLVQETVNQSRSVVYISGRVTCSLSKTDWLCWMCQLLLHAACGGVLMLVWLAEIHCMTSLEHVFCQGRRLDVPIFQCTVVFTHMLLQTLSSLDNVYTWAVYTGDGIHNSFVLICWDQALQMYQHLPESSQWSEHYLELQGGQDVSGSLSRARNVRRVVWRLPLASGSPVPLSFTIHSIHWDNHNSLCMSSSVIYDPPYTV